MTRLIGNGRRAYDFDKVSLARQARLTSKEKEGKTHGGREAKPEAAVSSNRLGASKRENIALAKQFMEEC